MIKTVLIVLLICSLCYCDMQQDKVELVETLQKLKTSKLGGDVFTALLLEMETNTNMQSVERINELITNMYDDFRELRDEAFGQKSNKYAFCVTKLHELEEELAAYDLKLAQARTRIPSLQEQQAEKEQQQLEKQEEQNLNVQAVNRAHEQNVLAISEYEASIQAHNDMISSLNAAKTLIEQLAASSFLQKSVFSEAALVQFKEINNKLTKKHHRSLINVLIQMAQNNPVSDQDGVSHIITIIDELVGYENDAKNQEGQNEQRRQTRFDAELARLDAAAQFLENDARQLVNDVVVLVRKISELEQDILDFNALVVDKLEQTDLQNRDCDDDLLVLEGRVDEYNEITDLIRAVMRLFRTFTMQNLRDVFAELN